MADQDEQPRRKRARLACVACNARRVKCNVTECRPCHNCAAGNLPCETKASRRGKHPRKSKVPTDRQRIDTSVGEDFGADTSISPTSGHREDEVAASQVLASLSGSDQVFSSNQKAAPGHSSTLISDLSPTNTTSLPSAAPPDQEDDAAVFLGESNSLRYVPDGHTASPQERRASSNRPLFRHSIPNAVKADVLMPQWELERRRSRFKTLQADGALSFPCASVRERLLKAYFQWFHPHLAVVDEPEIWKSHTAGTISPLLLQAMLFIGVSHCDNVTLDALGWGPRHRAKYLFYTRAKDIYDAGYETRKLLVIQSLFLMSFWRAGALLEKDVRHWLGVAINLAQTKALHRSTPDLEPQCTRLRRRVWWSIYTRERQCGSALGLPNRIRDEDCDIESLSPSDFSSAYDPSISRSNFEKCTSYMIGMADLARTLGSIVDAGYLPNRSLSVLDRSKIREELHTWKMNLPSVMQLSSDTGEQPSFQASMLHLAHNNLLILLHRSAFINNEDDSGELDGNVALQAAARNSRIVEDMLQEGTIGHAQIHVITNLFNTLCVHVAHLRRSNGINKTIAEHRAKLCLLGLQELQRTWDVTNWVLQLFFQYLDRTTAARLELEADDIGITSAAKQIPLKRQNVSTAASVKVDMAPPSGLLGSKSTEVPVNSEPTQDVVMTPWSWTTDEANQYLFQQIENDFAFGEGGILDWSPDTGLDNGMGGNILADLGHTGLDSLL